MIEIFLGVAWFIIFIIIVVVTYKLRHLINVYKAENNEEKVESLQTSQNWFYAFLVIASLCGIGILYLFLKGTIWESHLFEWLNLTVRLLHVTFGIAWIGASFYFVFLENALNRTDGVRDELAGNLWAVHGGGFYYLEKYKVAPKKIPKDLHWFKYEAYFTWLSGFCLLAIVYYFNAKSFLIDPEVLDIEPLTAIAISIGSLIIGWILYDQICKKLSNNKVVFTLAITALVFIFAWFYSQVFSGRGAYIHFGAFLGTLMAANVFFVIIPAQKAMVQAAKDGREPDPTLGIKAGLRSLHNNYFTLPVIFVMISGHFPSTYGHDWNWAVLSGLFLVSVAVKHFWNIYEQGNLYNKWLLPAVVIGLIALTLVTAPPDPSERLKNARIVSFKEVHGIINLRCTPCHSASPTDEVWKIAPNGMMFDTPEQIEAAKDEILNRAVITRTMPQA
ncbi:MAG: urate hydroxylase PuuD, partial [Bacteroidetes bacterium]|nr:urate hydroxylase PuuD [Bacteroidota bacterium]